NRQPITRTDRVPPPADTVRPPGRTQRAAVARPPAIVAGASPRPPQGHETRNPRRWNALNPGFHAHAPGPRPCARPAPTRPGPRPLSPMSPALRRPGVGPCRDGRGVLAGPAADLVAEPDQRVVLAADDAFLHRDQRVVGDLDVLRADLGAAL